MRILRRITANLHYLCTATLALAAIPLAHREGLPTNVNWRSLITFFWIHVGFVSVFLASLFCLISLPRDRTIKVLVRRYGGRRSWQIFLLTIFILGICFFGVTGVVVAAETVFIIEVFAHGGVLPAIRRIAAFLGACLYMFAGVVLVPIYDDLIVAYRSHLSYDAEFNRFDSYLLLGTDVSTLAHRALASWPMGLLRALDVAYFLMFAVLGSALVTSASYGLRRGLRFAGTCLTAYYIGLLIFYLWPTFGPFFICAKHFSRYPAYLVSFTFQKAEVGGALAIWDRHSKMLGTGFYTAFPSLHIALPVIAMWFLRRWRPVLYLLGAYNVLLLLAIPVLEWHYVIDLFAGLVVAAIAIVMVGEERPASECL